jgi:predicted enzyme related to lactoylglutathione lyase
MFFAVDPVGAAIGFWQAGQHPGAGVFNVPGAMSWNELGCRDVETAKAFYTDLLGWGIDTQDHGGFIYTVVSVGDRLNGGIYDITGILPDDIPAHWFVWFTVDGTDEAVERARSLGAAIQREPWDTMFGRMAVVSDPQGPTFGVVTP